MDHVLIIFNPVRQYRIHTLGKKATGKVNTTSCSCLHLHFNAAPHTMLFITGGAIGQGLPNALGAALACPGRRVIAFQADESGLYTIQALWSIARESADVTIVVCANRRYRILQAELARARYYRARTQGVGDHRSYATGERLSCTGEGVRHAGL